MRFFIALAILAIVLGFLARDSAFMHALGFFALSVAELIWTIIMLPFQIAQVLIRHYTGT